MFIEKFTLQTFGRQKSPPFSIQRVDRGRYLLELFELSKIFQDCGNIVFGAVGLLHEKREISIKSIEEHLFKCLSYTFNLMSAYKAFHVLACTVELKVKSLH